MPAHAHAHATVKCGTGLRRATTAGQWCNQAAQLKQVSGSRAASVVAAAAGSASPKHSTGGAFDGSLWDRGRQAVADGVTWSDREGTTQRIRVRGSGRKQMSKTSDCNGRHLDGHCLQSKRPGASMALRDGLAAPLPRASWYLTTIAAGPT